MKDSNQEFDFVLFDAGYQVGERARAVLSDFVSLRDSLLELTSFALQTKLQRTFAASSTYAPMLALIAHYIQGCPCTGELILEGFYSKAAAALKQDMELLARFVEFEKGCAREGQTPQMKHLARQTGIAYGVINSLAHPSVQHLLDRHVFVRDEKSGAIVVSVLPIFNEQTARLFYRTHCWLCLEFCYNSLKVITELVGEQDMELVNWWALFTALEEDGIQNGFFQRSTEADYRSSPGPKNAI